MKPLNLNKRKHWEEGPSDPRFDIRHDASDQLSDPIARTAYSEAPGNQRKRSRDYSDPRFDHDAESTSSRISAPVLPTAHPHNIDQSEGNELIFENRFCISDVSNSHATW